MLESWAKQLFATILSNKSLWQGFANREAWKAMWWILKWIDLPQKGHACKMHSLHQCRNKRTLCCHFLQSNTFPCRLNNPLAAKNIAPICILSVRMLANFTSGLWLAGHSGTSGTTSPPQPQLAVQVQRCIIDWVTKQYWKKMAGYVVKWYQLIKVPFLHI